jgi:hypothetical protein
MEGEIRGTEERDFLASYLIRALFFPEYRWKALCQMVQPGRQRNLVRTDTAVRAMSVTCGNNKAFSTTPLACSFILVLEELS